MDLVLFTKPGCAKCEKVKAELDLESLGVRVMSLTPDNPAALAFHGAVERAEKELPLLAGTGEGVVGGYIPIKKALHELSLLIDRAPASTNG